MFAFLLEKKIFTQQQGMPIGTGGRAKRMNWEGNDGGEGLHDPLDMGVRQFGDQNPSHT